MVIIFHLTTDLTTILFFSVKYDRILTTNIFFGSIKNRCFLYQGYKRTPSLLKRQQNATVTHQEMYAMKLGRTRLILKKMDIVLFFKTPSPLPGIQIVSPVIAGHRVVLHPARLMNRTSFHFSHDRIFSIDTWISDNLIV